MSKLLFTLLCASLLYAVGCSNNTTTKQKSLELKCEKLLKKASSFTEKNLDSALYFSRQAALLASKTNKPKLEAQAELLSGELLFTIGENEDAIKHLHKANILFEKLENKPAQANTNTIIGDIYVRTSNPSEALQSYTNASKHFKKLNNNKGLALINSKLGHFYEKNGDLNLALNYQEKALNYFLQHPDSNILAQIYDNIGSIYEDKAIYPLAQENFSKAYNISLGLKDFNLATINLNNIADCQRKTGQYKEAIKNSTKALKLAESLNIIYQIKSANRDLAKTYALLNKYDSAFKYLDDSYIQNEKIYKAEISTELARAQQLFKIEQKELQIKTLEKEKQFNKKALYLGLTGLIMISILLGYAWLQQKSKTKKEKALLETENQLNKEKLINAELNEQKLKTDLENTRLQEERLKMQLSMKSESLSRSALHLIQKNELIQNIKSSLQKVKKIDEKDLHKKLNKLSKSIDINIKNDDDWKEFETIFKEIHTNFFTNLQKNYPNLSPSEVRLCTMIRANLQSHEIASIMGISPDSLRIARYRLRKKLNIEKGANLFTFICNIT